MQCCVFNRRNLLQLGLGAGFPEDFDDFSSFTAIPVLELLNNSLPNNMIPVSFNSRRLLHWKY
jgi:hypothetical protein